LHPIVDPKAERSATVLATGLPAGPGGARGEVVFTSADAVAAAKAGKNVILVREETNPEDVEGMRAAQGILTARGGMTSHAALVARGWGKCCIVGARTNADTPEDARVARKFGAEGIGLFRTEHMFYGKGSEEALFLLHKMILSNTTEERVAALKELSAFVKRDIKGTLEAMDGLP